MIHNCRAEVLVLVSLNCLNSLNCLYLLLIPLLLLSCRREVVETIRRLLMTGALVLVGENSTMQIVVAILLAQLFIKLYGYHKPYDSDKLDFLSEVATYQVLLVMFILLLLRDEGFRSNNELLCDVCLVLSSLILVFADLTDTLVHILDQDADALNDLNFRVTLSGFLGHHELRAIHPITA